MKKEAWSEVKGSESKSNLAYAGATNPGVKSIQRVGSHHFPVLSLSVLKVVFLKFQPTFPSLAAFLGTTPKHDLIDINLKKIRQGTKKIVCHFLFVSSRFLANLINFRFLPFSGHFRTTEEKIFASSRGRKISCSLRKKNLANISRGEDFMADAKKSLFCY